MTIAKLIKALIAGMVFPAILLTIGYTILFVSGPDSVHKTAVQFIPLYVPILFGIANLVYVWIGDRCPIKGINARL